MGDLDKYLIAEYGVETSASVPALNAGPNQPSYGNFCFGHFNVIALDKATPNDSSNPMQYTVNYHYDVEGISAWPAPRIDEGLSQDRR